MSSASTNAMYLPVAYSIPRLRAEEGPELIWETIFQRPGVAEMNCFTNKSELSLDPSSLIIHSQFLYVWSEIERKVARMYFSLLNKGTTIVTRGLPMLSTNS